MRNGKVELVGTTEHPILELQRVAFFSSSGFMIPWLIGTLGILAAAVVLWPIAGLAKRYYRVPSKDGTAKAFLFHATRVVAVIDLLVAVGWLKRLSAPGELLLAGNGVDTSLILLEVGGLIGVVGSAAAIADLIIKFGRPQIGKIAKLAAAAMVVGCVSVAWLAINLGLVDFDLSF